MDGHTVVLDGIRYRIEDAKARGLIGERPVQSSSREEKETAPVRSPKKPANKATRPASKD